MRKECVFFLGGFEFEVVLLWISGGFLKREKAKWKGFSCIFVKRFLVMFCRFCFILGLLKGWKGDRS